MKPVDKRLLVIDAIVNLALGVLLLLFPAGIVNLLGLPVTNTDFYASILGAVLFGIGIALISSHDSCLSGLNWRQKEPVMPDSIRHPENSWIPSAVYPALCAGPG
jgi:hypothetical protein